MGHPEMRQPEEGRKPVAITFDFSVQDEESYLNPPEPIAMEAPDATKAPDELDLSISEESPTLVENVKEPEKREVPEGMVVAEPPRAVETHSRRVKERVAGARTEKEVFDVWRKTPPFDARALMPKMRIGHEEVVGAGEKPGIPSSFRIGSVDYLVDGRIGGGGMGDVYLVKGSNGMEYAVKIMSMSGVSRSIRAVQEACIQAGISPGVHGDDKQASPFVDAFSDRYKGSGYASPEVYEVALIQDGSAESLLIVMERMESTLKDRSKKAMKNLKEWGEDFPEQVLAEMSEQEREQVVEMKREIFIAQGVKDTLSLARNLKAMHAFGIGHRDIKPENILVDKDGGLNFGDFGISYSKRERETQNDGAYQTFMDQVTQIYALGISGVEEKTSLTDDESGILLNFTRDVIEHLYNETSEYAQWKKERVGLMERAKELTQTYEDYLLEPDVLLKSSVYMGGEMKDRQRSDNSSSTLTQTGIVMGTPLYMSPEAARGVTGSNIKAIQRSDDYSLGLVLLNRLQLGKIEGGSPFGVMTGRTQSGIPYNPVRTFAEEASGEHPAEFYLSKGVTPLSLRHGSDAARKLTRSEISAMEDTAAVLNFESDQLLQRLESVIFRLIGLNPDSRISLDDFIHEVELIGKLQTERALSQEKSSVSE